MIFTSKFGVFWDSVPILASLVHTSLLSLNTLCILQTTNLYLNSGFISRTSDLYMQLPTQHLYFDSWKPQNKWKTQKILKPNMLKNQMPDFISDLLYPVYSPSQRTVHYSFNCSDQKYWRYFNYSLSHVPNLNHLRILSSNYDKNLIHHYSTIFIVETLIFCL